MVSCESLSVCCTQLSSNTQQPRQAVRLVCSLMQPDSPGVVDKVSHSTTNGGTHLDYRADRMSNANGRP